MAMRMRFNSLKTRLIIVLLLLVILPTVTIGWIAHNMMFENIRSNRISDVGQTANSKHDQLVMVLTRANIRAEHFLSDLSDQCRFNSAKPDHHCAASLIRSYLAAEGAIGATLRRKGSDSLTIGTSATRNKENITFKTGQLAKFSGTGPDNNRSYFVSAAEESTGLQLAITYPSSMLEPVFNPSPADLELSGETFLADGEGFFVTKPRYHSTQGHSHPISARPMQSCLSGQSREVIDLDYRDMMTVMGFRFVPEFGSACIMAHIAQDEAFAPLKLLEQRLFIVVFLFGVILIITITYLARNIVKPITSLTKVARAITAGDYKAQAEIAGSDEILELSTSFNFMTNRLSATIEAAMDAVVQMNTAGIITGWNNQAEKTFGWTSEEAVGRVLSETIIPPQYRKAHVQGLKRFLHSGEGPILNSRIELSALHRDGHEFPVELTITSIKMAGKYEFNAFIRDIAERKQAEKESAKAAEELRIAAIAFEMQAAIVITDATPKILRVNRAFEEITGYTAAEAIGHNPKILSAPEIRKSKAFYEEMWADLISKGKWSGEVLDKRKNGEIYPKWLTITAVVAPDGTTTHYVGSFFDITKRKKAEQALRDSREDLYRLLNSMDEGVYGVNTDGNCTFVNQSLLQMLGYQNDNELLGKNMHELIHHSHANGSPYAASECKIYCAFQTNQAAHVADEVFWRKDGVAVPVEYWSHPVVAEGVVTGSIVTFVDITERKRAEELLRKSSEEIEDLYNHAPCGYHSLDKDGVILMINDTELAWLGYTRDEVIGRMKWPDLITSASLKTFRENFQLLKKQGFVHNIEAEIFRKDGAVFNGLINATAIYGPSGDYEMSRSTVADITERKRVEQQLRDLTAHLQTVRENEKVSIAREIHDDLGGTLTALKMETHQLKTELSQDKSAIPLLEHVESMSQLINTAAGITRRIISNLRPTILDDLGLLAALEWQAAQFHKHTGIECRVNCVYDKSEDCSKELDKQRSIALFRISQEALTNVARHSGASRVEIEFHHSDEEAMLSISDNGRGLPEGHAVKSGSYGMLGMRERAEQLGGTIRFDTPPGGGLSVTVILQLPANEEEKI